MEIWTNYNKDLCEFNELLKNQLNIFECSEDLFDGISYCLKTSAKRLRPLILINNAVAFSADKESSQKLALALELLHTASLVHDDLPCIDNDDYRRGQPACHKLFGEAGAVIIGDSLINAAYEILFEHGGDRRFNDAARYLAKVSGYRGMLGGQYLDIFSQNISAERELLLHKIHNLKTAELFKAAFVCGALLAELTKKEIQLIEEAAQSFGLAFQIKDDLIDVACNSEDLGKTAGKDELQDKLTFVRLYGIDETKIKLRSAIKAFKTSLDKLQTVRKYDLAYLYELADFIANV